MTEAYVIEAVRTPIGAHRGVLSGVRPDDLAARAIAAVVERSGVDPERIVDVYLGAANQSGEDNRNVARMAVLLAGLPHSVPGATVNRLCASGLDAVNSAARAIKAGEGDLFLAGGVESMSRAPWVLEKPEQALPRGPRTMHDTALAWRMINPRMSELGVSTESMGETAENVAERYGISREAQDAFALRSHRRAVDAAERGVFAEEIVAVEAPKGRRETVVVDADQGPRPDTSAEKLAALKPVFRENGTVTAGNASTLNDGAACLLIASERGAERLDAEPLARIVATGVAGVDPAYMGIGPVEAVPRALAGAGLSLEQIDLIEINEAFAAQVLACVDELGIDEEKLNVNGGAIALGHPLGCTGARLATTLVRELRRRGGKYGVATLCVGVGQGLATVFEAV